MDYINPQKLEYNDNKTKHNKIACIFVGIYSIYDKTHYSDVIMSAMVSQFTSLMIVFSIVYSDTDQRKHQSFASLAFVPGIHRPPVNSPHKGPVMQKMFPFDDVIMCLF